MRDNNIAQAYVTRFVSVMRNSTTNADQKHVFHLLECTWKIYIVKLKQTFA